MARTKAPKKAEKKVTPLAQQVLDRADREFSDDDGEERESRFLPTPSTMMNLACSDDIEGVFNLGKMVNLIGDSSSGKSIFALSLFAEANLREEFEHYRFIYDDVENACEFNLAKLFGERVAERIEPPQWYADEETGEEKWLPSETIEDFHCNIMDALEDADNPCIYVLDSFDALDAEQDQKKLEEFRDARRKGKKTAGSYNMAKPKKSSEILRQICGKLKRTESVLVIISQTRDNIDPLSFQKKTRSGGKALKFYATHEIWLAMAKPIKSKGRVIGNQVKAKISKNKITGKVREISFPIYYDYGIDDIRSLIQFLCEEGEIIKRKNTLICTPLGIEATEDKMIRSCAELRGASG